ncbi:MAG: DUF4979 domain-containing protein [Chitinophagaceae bacterium]
MRLLKYMFGAFVLLGAALLYTGCEKGPNFKEYIFPAPIVEDFSPKIGYAGEDITITGKDFGSNVKAVKIWFGGILSDTVRTCTDGQIVVKAPANGVTGTITVQVYNKPDSTDGVFTFLPSARIISVNAERGKPGDVVTITGENFGTDINAVEVYVGDIKASVVAVSATQVQFSVPEGKSGNIVLKVDRQQLVGPYFLVGDEKLSGTIIGHSGSWGNNPATAIGAALDGNLATFIDGPTSSGYVGYDVGAGKAAKLTSVRFAPRSTHPQRMMNGEIRGANDPTLYDFVTLHKITQQPAVGVYTEVAITAAQNFRYIYYYSPDGNCNIAEVEFYGNIVDQPLPTGKFIFEFNTAGNNEGWRPQQGGTWTVANGALNVTFTQATGNKRSDLALLGGGVGSPVTIHTGNYPIMAIQFNKPSAGNVVFDTNLGSFGNGNNKYSTEYAAKDVYYWDMSTLSLGSGAARPNEEITFNNTFQFKIADVPQANPATGYNVQWIRTFESKQALEAFINR